ncbi:MAG TPA: ABC transporter substrate binding protein [Geobacterales bacterium]|nr:ABC transporter substrate binding protein [Geobacterales bacterium]
MHSEPRYRTLAAFLTGVLLLALPSTPAGAADILIVQSQRIRAYEESIIGFDEKCAQSSRRVVLADVKGDSLKQLLQREKPRLIFVLGVDALTRVQEVAKGTPIVHAMVLERQGTELKGEQIAGVSMYIDPETQLQEIRKAVPGMRRLGIIYNPEHSSRFVSRARAAAESQGITLVSREIKGERELFRALDSMVKQVDGFWLIPDPTVVNPRTIEYLHLFFLEQRLPIISFSEVYLDYGAYLAITIDPRDIGKQAGEMAQAILNGAPPASFGLVDARTFRMTLNPVAMRQLAIDPGRGFLGHVHLRQR